MKKALFTLVVLGVGIYFIMGLFNINPPEPIITVDEKKLEVVQGSYCWKGLSSNVCADTASPPELIKRLKPTVVSPATEIKIEFKTEPIKNSIGVNQWLQNGETKDVSLNDNIITVPKEKGIYVYDVFARWDKGGSSYAFVIEVR